MTSASPPSQSPSPTPVELNGQLPPPPAPGAPTVRPPLRRSRSDKMAGGVCGGLGEHTGIDSLIWRVGFVALALAGGSGILVYLLLWVLMPPAPRTDDERTNPVDRLAERAHQKVYATGWIPPRP